MTETTPSLDLVGQGILDEARDLFAKLDSLPEADRIDVINALRLELHHYSPMRDEPVDCVIWADAEDVTGNDYNPNVVAPPEMELLELSITADGFTQPIVAWPTGDSRWEVVDGFHRHRVGREAATVRERVKGRLPITVIKPDRTAIPDRKAATVRHNRARGQHTVEGMSEIVVDLARRGKPDEWIGRHLGLDPDEVRRLRQVTGLAEMFADQEFSEAWEVDTFAKGRDLDEETP
ncbi:MULTISPECIES: IbrB-like domain-containing protein [Streptomyces]|uniref:IbrB-like domain-containing protein n=1 Tax=Streptomyces TaxID=1883 RepID=UPI0006922F52|nr:MULTISPECIES: ParB/RepB/Spo0J family partition protein [Streptomyces]